MLSVEKITVGALETNCYIVIDEKSALIIDPGDEPEYISQIIDRLNITPKGIAATHGHFDHVLGAFALQYAYNIPFLIHKKDEFLLSRMRASAKHFTGVRPDPPPKVEGNLIEGKELKIETHKLKIIHTPGHTPGSICLYCKSAKLIFVGDMIFKGGGLGRVDFRYSDKKEIKKSINKLLKLPDDTVVYSGHGEKTSIKNERKILGSVLQLS